MNQDYIEVLKKEDIEQDIRGKLIEFISLKLLPTDLSNLSFEHKMPLPAGLGMKIYIYSREISDGGTEIKSLLLPMDADRRNEEQIYVKAKCVIGKPRA